MKSKQQCSKGVPTAFLAPYEEKENDNAQILFFFFQGLGMGYPLYLQLSLFLNNSTGISFLIYWAQAC